MRSPVVTLLVAVTAVTAAPLEQVWRTLTNLDSAYVLRPDSVEVGGRQDFSLEYLPHYWSEVAGAGAAQTRTGAQAAAGGAAVAVSSEELILRLVGGYDDAQSRSAGGSKAQRVEALKQALNAGLLDSSDYREAMYLHQNPDALRRAQAAHLHDQSYEVVMLGPDNRGAAVYLAK